MSFHSPAHREALAESMKRKWEDPQWAAARNAKAAARLSKPFKPRRRYAGLTDISVYVDETLWNQVNQACAKHGLCKSDLIKLYITWGLETDSLSEDDL